MYLFLIKTNQTSLKSINEEINFGSVIGIYGPSGAGKKYFDQPNYWSFRAKFCKNNCRWKKYNYK